ncbi:MAG TPA: hypothetical protein VN706_16885 [Gemmatimonadaceae bacterium]|nr:hypothetical protein [Gemmatimonadaceae bacterium]
MARHRGLRIAIRITGVVLVAAIWAANALRPTTWTWERALNAAVLGAVVMPPLLGFIIAWMGTFDHSVFVVTFTAGAWLVLGGGFATSVVRAFGRRRALDAAHAIRLNRP